MSRLSIMNVMIGIKLVIQKYCASSQHHVMKSTLWWSIEPGTVELAQSSNRNNAIL